MIINDRNPECNSILNLFDAIVPILFQNCYKKKSVTRRRIFNRERS